MTSEGRAEYNSYNQGYFGQGERPIGARRDLDSGFELNRNRVSYRGVGADNLSLYRTSRDYDRTLPLR